MTKSAPAARPQATSGRRMRRRWSLLWILPERTARRLSWAVVLLLGVLPLTVVGWEAWRVHSGAWRQTIETHLASTLDAPVAIRRAWVIAPGHVGLQGLTIGADDSLMRLSAAEGTLQQADEELQGRLTLQGGALSADLGWWAGQTGPTVAPNLLSQKNLEMLTLRGFDVSLRLGEQTMRLLDFAGSVSLDGQEVLKGSFGGRSEGGDLVLRFELRGDSRHLTVRAENLPWAADLLRPTLGESLTAALGPCRGMLVLNPDLETGTAESNNWQLNDTDSTLDLAGLPEHLGLSGITGTLEVTLSAFGRLRGPATLQATLKSPIGARGTIPADVLQRVNYLLTGRETPPIAEDARYEALEVAVILTPRHIHLRGRVHLHPVVLTGAQGKTLLSAPTEGIPIKTFERRLRELERRWREAHSS